MNRIVSFLEVTDLSGAIVIGVFVLFTIGLMTVGAVLLAKAIQQQNKYNNTALPRMISDDDIVKNPEDIEASTVFDLESIEDEYDDEGFESDKWFAQTRGIDEEDLVDIRRRREQSSARSAVVEEEVDEEEDDDFFDEEEEVVPEKKSKSLPGVPRSLPEAPKGRSTSLPKI